MNFTTKLVVGVAAVFLAGIAVVLFVRNPEATRIEERLRAAVDDARAGRADAVLALLAPGFKQDGETFDQAAAKIRHHVRPGNFRVLESRSIDVNVNDAETRVVVFLRVDAESSPYAGGADVRLELTMRKFAGTWLVTGYRLPGNVADFLR